ncbi:MAG: PepSY domain-containing protein [Lachnospiraceae bacterium]|nr:PepSY domain-containing protein [Lachnospiraceae bacterium]
MKKAALDQDLDGNDVPHYDVDFYAKDMEYEYDIDPKTGAILKSEAEYDD